MSVNPTSTQWSDEKVIGLIRQIRNDLIKDFLQDQTFLHQYLKTHFNSENISTIRQEFIKKALRELLIAPVNTMHYEALILQIKETDTASLANGNEQFFYEEVNRIIEQYRI